MLWKMSVTDKEHKLPATLKLTLYLCVCQQCLTFNVIVILTQIVTILVGSISNVGLVVLGLCYWSDNF